jgi:hypothetical protein
VRPLEALTRMTPTGRDCRRRPTATACGFLVQKPDGFLRRAAFLRLRRVYTALRHGSLMFGQDRRGRRRPGILEISGDLARWQPWQ